MNPLHVLVIGVDSDANICGVFRTSMFVPHLATAGVEVRFATPPISGVIGPGLVEEARAMREGESDFEATEIAWANVIVFRRTYRTHIGCLTCGYQGWDVDDARRHGGQPGHHVEIGPEWLVRPLIERLESNPPELRDLAVVYETDDDLLDMPDANAIKRLYRADLELVERLARLADLVTTSTSVLASRLSRFNKSTRVVRNAVDAEWYGPRPDARPSPYPRILYFGSSGRLRDYEVCREAVDESARRHQGARRIWLGAPDEERQAGRLREVSDELLPFVVGVPAFCRALMAARPDIGVAPVLEGGFERAKSELHWLDYSMVGAATVASRTMGDGPYRVIRPGVDGFLARNRREWREAIARLASNETLRDEIAGRARERVLAEYEVRVRAPEWADAFRWAADHAGERRGDAASSASRLRAATVAVTTPPPARAPVTPSIPADVLGAYVAAQRFASVSPLRLHVGCSGHELPGWVTIDTAGQPDIVHNVEYGLPFGDGSVDRIYARNRLEDLGGMSVLFFQEAARTLRPGGVMRLVTRDRSGFLARRDRLAVQGVVLTGPYSVAPPYDEEMLGKVLLASGFREVRRLEYDESSVDGLARIESATAPTPVEDRLIVEAVR